MAISGQRDHYAVLGVSPTATQSEIAHAYRRLVRLHHPDTQSAADQPSAEHNEQHGERPPAAPTLDEVLAAYAVLRDPRRRAEYDRRLQPLPPSSPQPSPTAQPPAAPRVRRRQYEEPQIRVGPVRYHPR